MGAYLVGMLWKSFMAFASVGISNTCGSNGTRLLSTASSTMFQHFFTYTLSNPSTSNPNPTTLYVPLTSCCNSLTLPQTRGPNFLLSPEVVAALCRVRDAEMGVTKWKPWCMWLDMQESPQKLPIPDEKFQLVDVIDDQDDINNRRPSVNELVSEIKGFYAQERLVDSTWNIVIGGEGEPTLRLSSLILLIKQLRQLQPSCSIRVTTNGLLDRERTNRLLTECCDTDVHFSVALMTHDANQYTEIMRPTQGYSFAYVLQFIESTVNAGFQVEITAVNQPTVNKERTMSMAESLGITSCVRWCDYFPWDEREPPPENTSLANHTKRA